MLKRTLFFSNPYHISTKNQQLVLYDKDKDEKQTVPIEDIGFIVFEHPQITFTMSVLQLLSENNTAVIFCDNNYMPSSMLFNFETNNVQAKIFREQIETGVALKNNLWQQTIRHKIKNQAMLLKKLGKKYQDILNLKKQVKSGDNGNIEGYASRIYWTQLMGGKFRRDRFGHVPNNLLNYGYIILRSGVARALSGSGLLPTLGIFHRNKYNAFALADDIMEPYRPFVDELVYHIMEEYEDCSELNTELKTRLLQILTVDVVFEKIKRPLMVGLSQTTASLVKCYLKEKRKIEFPVLL
jgi:CRISPR-associated protein Cas1